MVPDLTEDEIRQHEADIRWLERCWALCPNCPGVEACPDAGWRPVAWRAEFNGMVYFAVQRCERGIAHDKQQRLDELLQASRLTKRFRERRFDNFEPRPEVAKALATAKRFAERFKPGNTSEGLVLVGPVGSGKTHLAAAIANDLLERGVAVVFCPVPDMLADLRAAVRDGREPEEVMDELRDAELLILDDLGAERVTDWVREQLFRLINYRYEQVLPIVATTNLTPEELEEHLGDRTVSRLMEMCRWVLVEAPDYRKRHLKG